MPATLITLAEFTAIPGVSLAGRPFGNLIVDGSGDLFGTTSGGAEISSGRSEVPADTLFEVAKTSGGYSAPENLAVLPDPIDPEGLVADANGDLFGTTGFGGTGNVGTVFEIAKSGNSYSLPTTLVSFDGADGSSPTGSLFVDPNGNLFGTTSGGGANNDGTLFEIPKTAGSYAVSPETLVNFNLNVSGGLNGPQGSLIDDANGDLFGTTVTDHVFEIVKTTSGYKSTTTALASISVSDRSIGDLVADANGDLFGTTAGLGLRRSKL